MLGYEDLVLQKKKWEKDTSGRNERVNMKGKVSTRYMNNVLYDKIREK